LVVTVSLDIFKIFVKDKFNPDFTDFLVYGSSLIDHVLFLVVFSEIEVAGAEFGGLGSVHLALFVNSFSQIFEGILVRASTLSGEEKTTEGDFQVSLVTLEFAVGDKSIFVLGVSTLIVLIGGKFEQIPESSDQEFFGLLETVTSHADVSLSKHEVGG
jgi:hypothetical protein